MSRLPPSSNSDLDILGTDLYNTANLAALSLEDVTIGANSALSLTQPADDSIQDTFPLPVPSPSLTDGSSLPSPDLEDHQPLEFKAIAGNLLPATIVLPAQQIGLKANPNLRLPSFDMLGIANPHPDRPEPRNITNPFSPIGAGPLSKPGDPLHILSPETARPHNFFAGSPPPRTLESTTSPHPYPSQLTPPYEGGPVNWSSVAQVVAAAGHSPAQTDPATPAISADGARSPATEPPPAAEASDSTSQSSESSTWLDDARDVILSKLQTDSATIGDELNVLTHALPCPSRGGNAFPSILDSIRNGTSLRRISWINVIHAVPGRFTVADTPTSPPTTPGPAIGGDDYFTSQTFDRAVEVADYQVDDLQLHRAPSPRTVIAPPTQNLSIVERYIPPKNEKEFNDMFSPNVQQSLLLDRLEELSPKGGLLLFIYPTKTGAQTFLSEHLSPIVAPLLREMQVVHGLSADVGNKLGRISAIDHLSTFPETRSKLVNFLAYLNTHAGSMERFRRRPASFELIYDAPQEVPLDRKVWAPDWWIKQEKSEIKRFMDDYFRRSKVVRHTSTTSTELVQHFLEGVEGRTYPVDDAGREILPRRGVEVGVFVIRKGEWGGGGGGTA